MGSVIPLKKEIDNSYIELKNYNYEKSKKKPDHEILVFYINNQFMFHCGKQWFW